MDTNDQEEMEWLVLWNLGQEILCLMATLSVQNNVGNPTIDDTGPKFVFCSCRCGKVEDA